MALAPRLFWLSDQVDVQGGSDPLAVHHQLAERLVKRGVSYLAGRACVKDKDLSHGSDCGLKGGFLQCPAG